MDGWDVALLVLAAYVAVAALVRMMMAHRDGLLAQVRDRLAERQQQLNENAEEQPVRRDRAA